MFRRCTAVGLFFLGCFGGFFGGGGYFVGWCVFF